MGEGGEGVSVRGKEVGWGGVVEGVVRVMGGGWRGDGGASES